MTDDELIERIRDGDEDSAEELIARYYSAILRYCRWHSTDDAQAEDLTQETFLRVFRNLAGYRKRDRFKAWLYTIATSCRRCFGYFQDERVPHFRADHMVAISARHCSGIAWLCTYSVYDRKVGAEVEKIGKSLFLIALSN